MKKKLPPYIENMPEGWNKKVTEELYRKENSKPRQIGLLLFYLLIFIIFLYLADKFY